MLVSSERSWVIESLHQAGARVIYIRVSCKSLELSTPQTLLAGSGRLAAAVMRKLKASCDHSIRANSSANLLVQVESMDKAADGRCSARPHSGLSSRHVSWRPLLSEVCECEERWQNEARVASVPSGHASELRAARAADGKRQAVERSEDAMSLASKIRVQHSGCNGQASRALVDKWTRSAAVARQPRTLHCSPPCTAKPRASAAKAAQSAMRGATAAAHNNVR